MTLTSLLAPGMPTRGDVKITSQMIKSRSINPGDIVKIGLGGLIEPVTTKTDVAYGVASFRLTDKTMPVVVKGHVVATIPSAIEANPTEGHALCCHVKIIKKIKAVGEKGAIVDAYEIKI